jgi:cell division septation protein DedD
MDYQSASQVRKKSLLSLIGEKRYTQEKSRLGSIGGAISDKFKAKVTGVKEKLDPLNLARNLFGQGALGDIAVTKLGRGLGRKEKDIGYFGGYRKKQKNKKDPQFTTIAAGPIKDLEVGDSIANILGKMYNFMKKTDEAYTLNAEISKAFRQEQMDEDGRRHEKLVKAIKAFTKGGKTVSAEPEKSWLDTLLNFYDQVKSFIQPITEFFSSKLFGWLSSFLAGPELLVAGVVGSIIAGGSLLSLLAANIISAPNAESLREGVTSSPMAGALAGDTAVAAAIVDPGLYDRQKAKEEADDKQDALAKKFDDAKGDLKKLPLEVLEAKKQQLVDYGYEGSRTRVKKGSKDKKDISEAKLLDNIDSEITSRKSNTIPDQKSAPSATPSSSVPTNTTSTPSATAAPSTPTSATSTPSATAAASTSVPTAQPVSQSANDPIPNQMPADSGDSNNSQPIMSVNTTTNNIGGKKPKIVQTSTARARNDDLEMHLRRISVPV